MGDYNRDSEQDKFIDNLLQEISGYSSQDLLDEFETACNLNAPRLNSKPSPDKFEKIWARVQEERAEAENSDERTEPADSRHNRIIKGRFGWKRPAAIGLIVCLMAGGGCTVATGTKSCFYREWEDMIIDNNYIFNNDVNKVAVNGEEEAYALTEEKLNIEPMRLSYMPADMRFIDVQTGEGFVHMKSTCEDKSIYFTQSKYDKSVSYNFKSDSTVEEEVGIYNKWLRMDLDIKKEIHLDDRVTYETSIITSGASYRLIGIAEEEEFQKVIEGLSL